MRFSLTIAVTACIAFAGGCASIPSEVVGTYHAETGPGEELILDADGSFRYVEADHRDVYIPGHWRVTGTSLTLDFVMVGDAPSVLRLKISEEGARLERKGSGEPELVHASVFVRKGPNKPVRSNSVDAPRKSKAVIAISRLPRSV